MSTQALANVVKARRKDIREQAPCEGCGETLAACKAESGKDPTAPPWFGCCARGTAMGACDHRPDRDAYAALLKEIESGTVRTVEEVRAERAERAARRQARRDEMPFWRMLRQGEQWKTRDSGWVRIADMEPSHRANTARLLLRRAPVIAKMIGFSELHMMVGAPDEVVDSWLHDDEDRVKDPEAWMRSTALYRALTEQHAEAAS